MRIAIFTDSFWPQINGVTTSIWNSCSTLAEQGHEFLIYAPMPPEGPLWKRIGKKTPHELKGAPAHTNVRIIWLPSEPLPTYTDYLIAYSFSSEAKKAFDSFNPDVVHVHTPFYVAKKGIDLAKKKKIPVIGTFHTLLSDFLDYVPIPTLKHNPVMKQLTWVYTQHFYKKCTLITTPTPVLAKELESHGFPNVQVLSNGIDYDLFAHAKAKKSTKATNLVYFGRISFEKRLDIAIEALYLLRKTIPNVELHFVGSGPAEPSLREQAREWGIEKFVHFDGPKRGKELASAVKSNHILIAPSPMETQGLYILEGMAAGLPVVGANARAIPVALGKNERGLLFTANDAADCAEKLKKMIQSPALQKKYSMAAQKWVKSYGKKAIAKEWLRTYNSLLS